MFWGAQRFDFYTHTLCGSLERVCGHDACVKKIRKYYTNEKEMVTKNRGEKTYYIPSILKKYSHSCSVIFDTRSDHTSKKLLSDTTAKKPG